MLIINGQYGQESDWNNWYLCIFAVYFLVKIGAIYALLVCKLFGPKIRPCKFFDKSQVCLVAYIRANTSMSVLEKLDFFKLLVWKRAYPFYPIKLSHFAEEIKSSSEIPKFHNLRSVVIVSWMSTLLLMKSWRKLKLFLLLHRDVTQTTSSKKLTLMFFAPLLRRNSLEEEAI